MRYISRYLEMAHYSSLANYPFGYLASQQPGHMALHLVFPSVSASYPAFPSITPALSFLSLPNQRITTHPNHDTSTIPTYQEQHPTQ